MPYLLINHLVAGTPVASTESEQGRMQVLLTVYRQWQDEQ
jgi:hypothetical protein